MLKIAVILGSSRPGRLGEAVAKWTYENCQKLGKGKEVEFEFVDIKDYELPLLDEPIPPAQHKYSKEHTKKWAAKIGEMDAFIFVSPEYNHSTSGALKNAIDFLYQEWNNKAAGFVAYGSAGGIRAVEHLRLIMAELQIATVRQQVAFSLFTDFEKFSKFNPDPRGEKDLEVLLGQLISWGKALKEVRER